MERIDADTLHFSFLVLPLGELSPQATERANLALPPGELSPKVTERVLQ